MTRARDYRSVSRERSPGNSLDLNARVVKAGSAAQVGKRVGHEGVGGGAVQRVVTPNPLGKEDDSGAEPGVATGRAADFP